MGSTLEKCEGYIAGHLCEWIEDSPDHYITQYYSKWDMVYYFTMILISLSQQKRDLPWKVFVLVVMVGKRGGYSVAKLWEREREREREIYDWRDW